ncbi:MAG: VOC family protein [Nanoarchaeota archaeon]
MRLSTIVLYSSDLEKSLSFYSSLGLNFKEEQHGGPIHYSFEREGLVFEIYPSENDLHSSGLRLELETNLELSDAISALDTKYIRKISDKSIKLSDPDNNIVIVRKSIDKK